MRGLWKGLASVVILSALVSGCGGEKGNLGYSSRYSSPNNDNNYLLKKVKRGSHHYRWGLASGFPPKSWGHVIMNSETGEVLSRYDLMRDRSQDVIRRTVFSYDSNGKYLGRIEIVGERFSGNVFQCTSKYYDPAGKFLREEKGAGDFEQHLVTHTPKKARKKLEKVRGEASRFGIKIPRF